MKYLKRFNHINEGRVPRADRIELYKDKNIIVVVPLTHDALKKYAHGCQWCINGDFHEWNDYHRGHSIIIQRNPKGNKIGITGMIVPDEIFVLEKWDSGHYKFEDACGILGYNFESEEVLEEYYMDITSDINNFATDIVYYSSNGVYDMWDNNLHSFNYTILDVPNVTKEVVQIMDNFEKKFLKSEQIVESVNNEDSLKSYLEDLLVPFQDMGCFSVELKETQSLYGIEISSRDGGLDNKEIPEYLEELSTLFTSLNKLKNRYKIAYLSQSDTSVNVYKDIEMTIEKSFTLSRLYRNGTSEMQSALCHIFEKFDILDIYMERGQIKFRIGSNVPDEIRDLVSKYKRSSYSSDGYAIGIYGWGDINDSFELIMSSGPQNDDKKIKLLKELYDVLSKLV